jgi:hypothetical protein
MNFYLSSYPPFFFHSSFIHDALNFSAFRTRIAGMDFKEEMENILSEALLTYLRHGTNLENNRYTSQNL